MSTAIRQEEEKKKDITKKRKSCDENVEDDSSDKEDNEDDDIKCAKDAVYEHGKRPTTKQKTTSRVVEQKEIRANQDLFDAAIIEALTLEAKNAILNGEKEMAYLSGVDWSRVEHGKNEGPGCVVVARGIADALIKLHNAGEELCSALYEDSDNYGQPFSAKDVSDAIVDMKQNALDTDCGLRVWRLIDTSIPATTASL